MEEIRQIFTEQWNELTYGEKLSLRNVGVLMAFLLIGAYILVFSFSLNLYTIGVLGLMIVACSLAGNFLHRDLVRKGLDTDEEY
jgi:hypothetical protein